MGLEEFMGDEEDDNNKGSSSKSDVKDIEVPETLWRYFLSRCDGYVPVHCTSQLEDEEIEIVISFIEKELSTSRPFAWEKDSDKVKKMEENKEKLREYLEKRND